MKCSVLVKPETVLVNQISVSVFSGEVQIVSHSIYFVISDRKLIRSFNPLHVCSLNVLLHQVDYLLHEKRARQSIFDDVYLSDGFVKVYLNRHTPMLECVSTSRPFGPVSVDRSSEMIFTVLQRPAYTC